MRAGLRFGIAAFAAALTFAPLTAVAQNTAAPATNTPATDTIGPRELENFSLNGTVTRPAPTAPARTTPVPATTAPRTTATPPATAPARAASRTTREPAAPAPSVVVPLPPADGLPDAAATVPTDAAPTFDVQSDFEPDPPAASRFGNIFPWLLFLTLLAAGISFYVRRHRSRLAYATAGEVSDSFAAAEPAVAPSLRREALRPAPAQAPASIVSTRLRPWLEIEFSPGRCVVEDDKATIQFDVAVFNSGSAPARDVLIEASMFNAGPTQDQEIGAFFAHPVAKGERIAAIPPLQRIELKSAVSLTRDQMRQFEVAGKRIFVPMIGFNALYRWSGGDGQTSASYLVGRDTKSEKMAPLRLHLGPRIFRGLGARQHNLGVRT